MTKIKKGDKVKVMRGKDAGKIGEVLKVVKKSTRNVRGNAIRIIVQGVNIVKKSQKPNPQFGIQGGIVEFEKPIDASNVMYIDEKGKTKKVGFKVDEKTGKKERIFKK